MIVVVLILSALNLMATVALVWGICMAAGAIAGVVEQFKLMGNLFGGFGSAAKDKADGK